MAHYSSSLVANAFLLKASQTPGQVLTHMKLQKLVFFVHAWSLALHGESMLAERPEAWDYGPVFEDLYHELKGYGYRGIDAYLTQMNPATGQRQPMVPEYGDSVFWQLCDQVWQRYSPFTALQLSAMTHERGGPWESARRSGNGWLNDDEVMAYYRQQLATSSPQQFQAPQQHVG